MSYHTFSIPIIYHTLFICHTLSHLYQLCSGSDESSVSTSEGSDSSCEAMEGPHSDDDGLVITDSSACEDL